MHIIVNGESKEFKENISLLTLLSELSLVEKVMAAAVNMDIVKQDAWDKHILSNNDKVELLDFVGGG